MTSAKLSVLLVEDEENLHDALKLNLELEGYEITSAYDGHEALKKVEEEYFDLIIMDVMLPGLDGISVTENIRLQNNEVPILILSAKNTSADRVTGLKKGADDYLTKPFSPRELAARVKAILRRGRGTTLEQQILAFRHLKIDMQRHEVQCDGESVELTALEFKLLSTMASYPQMVLTRQQLLERVWGYDFYGEERVVDVHIGHVRQKIEADPSEPQFILTVRGVGYKFADEPL